MHSRSSAPKWAFLIYLAVLALVYIPIAHLFVGSLRLPQLQGWGLHWYRLVIANEDAREAFSNSLWVATCSSAIATWISLLACLSLHRRLSVIEPVLKFFSSTSLLLPEIIFALSLLTWFSLLHWPLTLQTVIISHVLFSVAYVSSVLLIRLHQLDHSLEEVARDLGASEFQIQTKVVLPQIIPSVMAGFLLSFLISMDDFLITFFVNGVGEDTLPVKLYSLMRLGLTPQLNALAVLIFLFSAGILVLALTYLRRSQRNS